MGLDRLEKIVKAIRTEEPSSPLRGGSYIPVDGLIVNWNIEMQNSFAALVEVARSASDMVRSYDDPEGFGSVEMFVEYLRESLNNLESKP